MTINLLVRYLYHVKGYKRAKIVEWVDSFMYDNYKPYDDAQWYGSILKYIKKAPEQPLRKIKGIPVTQLELDTISSINNPKKERYLFVLLCLAKYRNLYMGLERNNNWVNYKDNFIFKQAGIYDQIAKRDYMVYELKEAGYVTNSLKNSSVSIRVNFIDVSDVEPALVVTDMRELGYQYRKYKGDKTIKICRSCSVHFRVSSPNKLYCDRCKTMQENHCREIRCSVCGEKVYVSNHNTRTTMCLKHRKQYLAEKRHIQYVKRKNQN